MASSTVWPPARVGVYACSVSAVTSSIGDAHSKFSYEQTNEREQRISVYNHCRWMSVAIALTVLLALCLMLFVAVAVLSKCMLML